jgi:DNA-binding GntR family transcriptional regulator
MTEPTPADWPRMPPRTPRYAQLAQWVIGRIKAGTWAEGQKLLSESDLAHDSGYGRDTVRHGMQIARDKGYVVITHGIGTFVNTADHWT